MMLWTKELKDITAEISEIMFSKSLTNFYYKDNSMELKIEKNENRELINTQYLEIQEYKHNYKKAVEELEKLKYQLDKPKEIQEIENS